MFVKLDCQTLKKVIILCCTLSYYTLLNKICEINGLFVIVVVIIDLLSDCCPYLIITLFVYLFSRSFDFSEIRGDIKFKLIQKYSYEQSIEAIKTSSYNINLIKNTAI